MVLQENNKLLGMVFSTATQGVKISEWMIFLFFSFYHFFARKYFLRKSDTNVFIPQGTLVKCLFKGKYELFKNLHERSFFSLTWTF